MMEVTWHWGNSIRINENKESSVHIPENKMDLLFSRLMKKTKTWNNHTRVKTRIMCTYKLGARVRKDKNESKALSLPDWNPHQEAVNFSVLLEIMPQANVKGI